MPKIVCPICKTELGNGEALVFEPNTIVPSLPVLRHMKDVADAGIVEGDPNYRQHFSANPWCAARIDVI